MLTFYDMVQLITVVFQTDTQFSLPMTYVRFRQDCSSFGAAFSLFCKYCVRTTVSVSFPGDFFEAVGTSFSSPNSASTLRNRCLLSPTLRPVLTKIEKEMTKKLKLQPFLQNLLEVIDQQYFFYAGFTRPRKKVIS